jgi:DNA-binding transcriptional regulator YhcF (GntR family)
MPIENQELTTLEKMVIKEWRRYEAASGTRPSTRYLAGRCGVYPNAIAHAIKSLKKKGYTTEKKITITRLTLNAKAIKAAS